MNPKTLGPRLEIAFARPQLDFLSVQEPRIGDGRVCHITRNRIGREAWLLAPEDPGTSNAPPGNTPPPRTYTQEEHQAALDAAIGKRLGEVNKKTAEEKKALADKLAEIEREKAELAEKLETVGKTKEELERINADKAAKQIEKAAKEAQQREAALTGERDTWRGKYLDREVSDQLGRALDAAKVLTSARSDAIQVLKMSAEIAKDDDGRITSITYEGVAYDTPEKAAMAFLKMKPYLASAGTPGGGGTRPPSGSGAPSGGRQLFEMSDEELQAMDRARARR